MTFEQTVLLSAIAGATIFITAAPDLGLLCSVFR